MLLWIFIFEVVNVQVALSCFYWLYPVDQKGTTLESDCCEQKEHGDHIYRFKRKEDTSEFKCNSDCVYTRTDQPDSNYCFKKGGSIHSECEEEDVTIEWFDGMEPVHYCVAPGFHVTFRWPKNKDYNVISLPIENYTNCVIDNKTAETSPYIFSPKTKGIKHFASFYQCKNGTKSTIVVDNNCTCRSAHEPKDAWDTDNARFAANMKKLITDSHVSGKLNWTQAMHTLFRLNLIILSESQGEVLLDSTPCSSVRIDCFKCMGALIEAALGCILDNRPNCPEIVESSNESCFSCICQITKTCIKSIPCPTEKREPVTNTETNHPCNRNCSTSEPKKCFFNLRLERLYSDTDGRRADGRNRSVLAYNGQIPGPQIVLCEGDELVVNLMNGLTDTNNIDDTTTLHFHGIREINKPWSDGVPWVSQCPILPGEHFTYGFNATNSHGAPPGTYTQPGTYWYHSHMLSQRTNGAYGAVIIKPKRTQDYSYDVDDPDNTIMLQEWYDSPINQTITSLLINGNGRDGEDSITTNYTQYNITNPGQAYQFRVIGAISQNVPLRLSVENHTFTAIATDSQDIEPVHNLTDLWVAAGERYHILLQTKENYDNLAYKIRVFGYEEPNGPKTGPRKKTGPYCTIAWLHYPDQQIDYDYVTDASCSGFDLDENRRTLNPVPINFHQWKEKLSVHNWTNNSTPWNIFIEDLRAKVIKPSLVFYPRTPLGNMLLNTQYIELVGDAFNNISMRYPRVPFLLQDPPNETYRCGTVCNINVSSTIQLSKALKRKYVTTNCTSLKMPAGCQTEGICPCQHVLQQPYAPGYWVEIVLINNKKDGVAHPIHMHGGWFWVLGMGKYDQNINRTFIEKEDGNKANPLPRNFNFPPAKDTIQVPPGGYVILRYSTDNAGAWIMHCHIASHLNMGMAMVLQTGSYGKPKKILQDMCTGPLEVDKNTVCKTPPSFQIGDIQWRYGMAPVDLCKRPGSIVTFAVWGGHNVNRINLKEFQVCNVNNSTSVPSLTKYVWKAPSDADGKIFYLACGRNHGGHCWAGMRARIVVRNDC